MDGALVALLLAAALVVSACGDSSTGGPLATPGRLAAGSPGSSVVSLTTGLSAGLGRLDSYQFRWTLSTASSVGSASPGESGAATVPSVSGTVVNKGSKSFRVTDAGGVEFTVVGDQSWTSIDQGKTWATADIPPADISNLLVDDGYATWFDKNAAGFKVVGDDTKNGVPCLHYQGDSSLNGIYASTGSAAGQFTADLWIAKAGNFPVSGAFGYTGSVGGKPGSFGFTFDVSRVNDSANAVVAPASVLTVPTDAPATPSAAASTAAPSAT